MSDIELRPQYAPALIPDAARGLVQWAQSASAAYELAQRLVTTSFAPAQYKGKPDEAAAAMLAGAEVGLSPMASLRAFDVIQGVAAPRAITLRAIVQSMGHHIEINEQSGTRVKGRAKRRGSDLWQESEWTIQRATQLGLTGKDQWKKQPQTMLIARVTSELARLVAADAILGIPYSAEELIDSEPDATVTITAKPRKATVARAKPDPVEVPEPTFDEPAEAEPEADPEPADAVELITEPQMRKMQALFHEKGFKDRDDRLDYVRDIVQIDVASSKELTKDQASAVIDALGQVA